MTTSPSSFGKNLRSRRPALHDFLLRALYALPTRLRHAILDRRDSVRPVGRPGDAPTHTDAELVQRADEFNGRAEGYWLNIAADDAERTHVYRRPLSTPQEAADVLYRLGLVIRELRVGAGHTVLDLGAGSCWLSAWLNRMGCRTISIDVSPTALALGRDLFTIDPRQRGDLDPRFVVYDGHRFPLDDASVDRVVSFDAFHHVPNQREVLSEIYRVLKPGGCAVFSEPGRDHAHADHSRREVERAGVLENDIDPADFFAKARASGFGEPRVKPYADPCLEFGARDYLRFMAGGDYLFPVHVLRRTLRHSSLFVLPKGEAVIDSRNPGRLLAQIAVPRAFLTVRGAPAARVPVPITVTNTGDTVWRCEVLAVGGHVGLGAHLLNDRREVIDRDALRTLLSRDVAPGDHVDLVADLTLPSAPGRYVLMLDMVVEQVAWFEERGSIPVEIAVISIAN